MNKELELNPNKVVAFLGKPAREFTKADIVEYIRKNDVRMVNFMYPAGDGRLKTLNFVINYLEYLDTIPPVVSVSMVRASSHLSRLAVATSTSYLVLAPPSSIPLPRFLP